MNSTFSLGSVRGIRLGIHWTVLMLLGLLMWLLATEIFPQTNPGLSDNTHFLMAVVASLAFFASIILHELGHALQARRDGMEIDGITLWLFGGVARFRSDFPTAWAELRVAAAGPAVSALLAALFLGTYWLPGLPEGALGVAGWLGLINLVLLGFNLIPALPLDGGRILHALIWRARADRLAATRACARVAQVIAVALIGVGILLAVTVGGVSGIWLAFIAWFLLQAGRAELAMAEATANTPRVARLMHPAPAALSPGMTLAAVVARDGWPPFGTLYPVMRADGPAGLLVWGDIDTGDGAGWLDDLVVAHMLPPESLALLAPNDEATTATIALAQVPSGYALVMDRGRPVGVLTRADLPPIDMHRADAASPPLS